MSAVSNAAVGKMQKLCIFLNLASALAAGTKVSWHGVIEQNGELSETFAELQHPYANLSRPTQLSRQLACSVTSMALFPLNSSHVFAAGCVAFCQRSTSECSEVAGTVPELAVGTSFLSSDGGVHWKLLASSVPELLLGRASAVTVTSPGKPSLHCFLGGHDITVGVDTWSENSAPRAAVLCSGDGQTWVRQAEDLPLARSRATAVVHTIPGEAYPRIILMAGFLHSNPMLSSGSLVPPASWMTMSAPIVLPPELDGLPVGAGLIGGWQDVDTVPELLLYRAFPVAQYWPGVHPPSASFRYSSPALVLGSGYHRRDGAEQKAGDWWRVGDPRNASDWIQTHLSHLVYSQAMSAINNAWPVVSMTGNWAGTPLDKLPQGTETYHHMLLFTDMPKVYALALSGDWVVNPSLCATTFSEGDGMGDASAVPLCLKLNVDMMQSAVAMQDEQNRPFVVVLYRTGIMRVFLQLCDHTCEAGRYAVRCGLTPETPLCAPCSNCTGWRPGMTEGEATLVSRDCRSRTSRKDNFDTLCTPCSPCLEGNATVVPCTATQDTVCGPIKYKIPAKQPYFPSSAGVEEAHAAAMSMLPLAVAAALCCVGCLSGIRRLVSTDAMHWPQEEGKGAGIVVASSSTVAGQETMLYLQSHSGSASRERIRQTVMWLLSSAVTACDILLVLLCHISVMSVGLALQAPDPQWASLGALQGTEGTFSSYGRSLVAVVAVQVVVLACALAWMAGRHRVTLAVDAGGAVSLWAEDGCNRLGLAVALVLLPLHTRLCSLLLPSGPLRFPASLRLATLLSLCAPLSLIIFDVPALALLLGALSYSGYPSRLWTRGGAETESGIPSSARWAVTLLSVNLCVSLLRVAWDIAACARDGGWYRFRRAVLALPEWQWLAGLLLPHKVQPPQGRMGRTGPVEVVPQFARHGGTGPGSIESRSSSGNTTGAVVYIQTPLPTSAIS